MSDNTSIQDALILQAMRDKQELIDVLRWVIVQACEVPNHEGDAILDSMALSAYADALRLLERYGVVRIKNEVGRRVIAEELF